MMQETQNELNLLKHLLENLGFRLFAEPDGFTVIWDHKGVGCCTVYCFPDNEEVISILLMLSYIPKEIINQLLLLGFEIESSDWIKYRVTIKGTTDDNSTESGR